MLDRIKDNQSVVNSVIAGIIFLCGYQFQKWQTIEAQNNNQHMYNRNEVIKEAITIYQKSIIGNEQEDRNLILIDEYEGLANHAHKILVYSDIKTYDKYLSFLETIYEGMVAGSLRCGDYPCYHIDYGDANNLFLDFLYSYRIENTNYNRKDLLILDSLKNSHITLDYNRRDLEFLFK